MRAHLACGHVVLRRERYRTWRTGFRRRYRLSCDYCGAPYGVRDRAVVPVR